MNRILRVSIILVLTFIAVYDLNVLQTNIQKNCQYLNIYYGNCLIDKIMNLTLDYLIFLIPGIVLLRFLMNGKK